jgi:hypothetical protein
MNRSRALVAGLLVVGLPFAAWRLSLAQVAEQARTAAPTANGKADSKTTIVSGTTALPAANEAMQRASREMAQAALNLWAALSPEQQAKAGFPFEGEERFNWHFVPRERKGITWHDLNPAQQKLAQAFLASGLSNRGFQQVETIMSLEDILKDIERGSGPLRDANNYAFCVFGTPGERSTWGWRFEGHHISMTFTMVDGYAVGGPVFFGTNPHRVLDGPRKGLRVLAVEEDLGRELVKSLTAEQARKAIYDTRAPRDIITANSRKANVGEPVGLAASDMTAAQQKLLMTLVENYAYRLRPELADDDLAKIAAADFKKIYFAWAGDTEPGRPHYYRLHGPTFLVEYDNTQNNANHVHSVWRDAANDFGEDLLKAHYERAAKSTDHDHDHDHEH